MANSKILTPEDKMKLRQPIDEYVGKIQKQIDVLRKDGTAKVLEYQNIIDGIITGIRNAAESLFNALKDLAKKALQAAKDVLGIESPSKVFRDQVGRYIPAGVALGIRNNLGQVKAAVRQMSATATDNFAATLQMDTQESKRASGGGVSSGHGITVNQYIYSKSQTAADLMQEARYQAEMAVMLGV